MDEEYLFNSNHICAIYGITFETVRKWCNEFARHLSPGATPGRYQPRRFTEEDMAVIDLIADMKKVKTPADDIHAALDNGQRGQRPEMPPKQIESLASDDNERALALEMTYLKESLVRARQERDEALAQLEDFRQAREENIRNQVKIESLEKDITELHSRLGVTEERVKELTDERSRLEREVGQAYVKGAMDVLNRQNGLANPDSKSDS